jgi:hypothetical protein
MWYPHGLAAYLEVQFFPLVLREQQLQVGFRLLNTLPVSQAPTLSQPLHHAQTRGDTGSIRTGMRCLTHQPGHCLDRTAQWLVTTDADRTAGQQTDRQG